MQCGVTKCPVADVLGYAVSFCFTISDANCLVLFLLLLLLLERGLLSVLFKYFGLYVT